MKETSETPSVHIVLGTIDSAPAPNAAPWSRVHEDSVYLGWPGAAKYQVGRGRIVVDPDPNASAERVRLFLLGAAMGVLLHRAGFLVLHGSAVLIGDRAVVFIAPKRGGKSTIAAALVERGCRLVTDDVIAIDFTGPEALVLPGLAHLKLWPDAVEAVGRRPDDLPRIHPAYDKRGLQAEDLLPPGPVPVAGVFVLEESDDLSIELLEPSVALRELITHWYSGRFEEETLEALGIASQFRGSATIANSTPCYRLRRPKSLGRIFEVAEAVEKVVSGR